ncbi:MAG TPA: hypothetical protein PKC26_15800, partial [Plasticicumulans sp.]|nr:hypothetical protein [Plasticicumulans sp.]
MESWRCLVDPVRAPAPSSGDSGRLGSFDTGYSGKQQNYCGKPCHTIATMHAAAAGRSAARPAQLDALAG